ncbi:pili assembly chaperone SafB [Salmonella enterica]|uniref:Pili assembly chaperone PapD n=2 Tax=Salmonella enterica TaxID=28901 RepID=A0A701VW12_SALDE|nr:pili assembly chaperone SafB [Salmonella enterica]EBK4678909.1 pili assembly chaperone protein SafB [Salmonella enterica]PZM44946.1 pili assembly chaperone protein SafB [Salmonella enterica subsp. enterica serovar Derby]QDL24837.1 pili assembly chaperone protein SafB [Salmonella enterica]HAC6396359.1 pili assembly chaperone PapD [Salmonella enterica subsp. enterica serovar Derby]HAK2165577.1 pili assembly chaperone PapD [Salmonella enterica]
MKTINFVLMAVALFASNSMVSVYAARQQLNSATKSFSVKLGATRVIYHAGTPGATLSVSNPQDYPILVQSSVKAEDKNSPAPFMVMPPLFRLEANQQSQLRIIRTGGDMPKDRETLQWVCIKALPPENEPSDTQAKGATLDLNLSISTCDKLIFRPDAVKGTPEDVAGNLRWVETGNKLKVENPTPFYMNLASVTVGGKPITGLEYIPPFADKTLNMPGGTRGDVEWKIITDLGGESHPFHYVFK